MSTPKRHPLTLAVAVALGLGGSQVASAAEFTVTNTNDSGAGSLRAAIDQANTSGDASNTVVFDGTMTGTITLNSSIFVENNSLVIQGPGPETLIVEQDGQVMRLSHTAASVAISGLTLRHTAGSTSAEAPLFSHSPSLSIDNVHFRGESANVTNFGYGGGCLASSQWTTQLGDVRELNVTNSEFDNCRTDLSYSGGAIYARQVGSYGGYGGDLSVTIENTAFLNGFAGGGAAAYIRQETADDSSETSHAVTIDGVTAENNESYGGYGVLAIFQDRDSSLDIDNLAMSGNSGSGTLEFSTGRSSTASIRDASFLNNDAGFEPLLFVNTFGSDLDFELVGSRFSNAMGSTARFAVETALSGGGGHNVSIRDSLIHSSEFDIGAIGSLHFNEGYGGDTFEIVNTTITDNRVGNFALVVDPPFGTVDTQLRHVTITDNTLTGGQPRDGERGVSPTAPAMVSLGAGGTRRITNSIIQGVALEELTLQNERGLAAYDLTSSGAVDVDHSLVGLVDPNVTTNDLGGSLIDAGIDPNLQALADNGGRSQTRAFANDSPVFDAGNPNAANLPGFDQRGDGFVRASGEAPDMGAFELQSPKISVGPDVDFGAVNTGATSASEIITIDNTGDGDLQVSGFDPAVGAPFALDFSDCGGSLPFTVASGASCDLSASFSPTATGLASATITVQSDSPTTDNSNFTLTGTGVVPGLGFQPLSFGNQLVGQSTQGDITLTNTGDGDLEIDSLSLGSPRGSVFTLDSDDCGGIIAPDDFCTVTVGFTPAAEAGYETVLSVSSNASAEPAEVPISGQGVIGRLAVSPSGDIGFGDVELGDSGDTELTVTNEGSAPLTIEDWSSLPDPFSISGDCPEPPFTLEPGESCTLIVTFAPESAGDYEQSLELGFNDGTGADSTQIAVSGRGAAPVEPALPVPTLDRIGLIIGSGLLALMGLVGLRRRRTPNAWND